ncbi:Protein of unknown function [Bacillus toyonensis]|nr:Protein of unknown function [Bacillus toyonensis]
MGLIESRLSTITMD